jgi:hypothetical protein
VARPHAVRIERGRSLVGRLLILVVAGGCAGTGPGPATSSPLAATVRPTERPGSSATASPTPREVPIPASVDASGGDDVTEALQALIDGLPDDTVLSFPSTATYRVDGTLMVDQRRGLTFSGGATLRAPTLTDDPERAMWRVRDSEGIVFRDLRLVGANPDPGTYVENFEWQHAFDIQGGRRIEIDRVSMTSPMGDCVYVTDSAEWADGIWVHDSSCTGTGRHGIAIVAGRDVVVERNTFSRIAYVTFDLEPNPRTEGRPQGAADVTIQGNRVTDTQNEFFSAGGSGPIDRVTVRGNDARGATYGLWSSVVPKDDRRRSDLTFEDNLADTGWRGGGGAAVTFTAVDGLSVRYNVQPFSLTQAMTFARVTKSCDVIVTDNDTPGALQQAAIEPFQCP